ncbi:hypothetical protein QQ73_09510, partial [Candidatus Endoriftia persephone str. Guaymas]|nr:hypothetical protein [Candidatus Endoriftia persephone str. Guaymas]
MGVRIVDDLDVGCFEGCEAWVSGLFDDLDVGCFEGCEAWVSGLLMISMSVVLKVARHGCP